MELIEPVNGFLSEQEKISLLNLLKDSLLNYPFLNLYDIKYFSASRNHILGIYKRRLNNLDHPRVTKNELTNLVNNLSDSDVDNVNVAFLPSGETDKNNLVFFDKSFNILFGIIHALKLEN